MYSVPALTESPQNRNSNYIKKHELSKSIKYILYIKAKPGLFVCGLLTGMPAVYVNGAWGGPGACNNLCNYAMSHTATY